MKTINLFIVDNDLTNITGLRNYLNKRFGPLLNIFTFYTGENAIKKIDKNTSIVVIDYYVYSKRGNTVLASINSINPETKIIMLSSNEKIGADIDSFRKGESNASGNYTYNDKKRIRLLFQKYKYRARSLVREFFVRKYLLIFLLTFAIVGVSAYLVAWVVS